MIIKKIIAPLILLLASYFLILVPKSHDVVVVAKSASG